MTDLSARLRTAAAYYDQSYPPSVLGGGGSPTDPHIDSISPTSMAVGGGTNMVRVNGQNFESTSVVELNGAALETAYISPIEVRGDVDPAVPGVGTHMITVRNINDEESNSVPFTVGALAADDQGADDDQIDDYQPDEQTGDQPEPSAGEVCAGTVDEVKAHVLAHPASAAEILDTELAGKNRATLVTWLDDLRATETTGYEPEAEEET